MIEIAITSAFQFLKIAHEFKETRGHPAIIEFYRGHSNKDWRLLPSLYRSGILNFEEKLVNEFIRRRPDEFSENDGVFNVLAKMQHYGLQTRLLDVTENPAVALYFACCENKDETDGEVFIFQKYLDEIPSNTASNIIAEFNLRQKNDSGHYQAKNYYDTVVIIHNEKDVEMAFYHISTGYDCLARPKIISERILRQAGAFLLFANEVCPRERCSNEKCIHRETAKCEKDRIKKNMSERVQQLSIMGSFRDFTDPHVENEQEGHRYIIRSSNKKKILFELETIGITRAFLFPELVNEGLAIMEDYFTRISLRN